MKRLAYLTIPLLAIGLLLGSQIDQQTKADDGSPWTLVYGPLRDAGYKTDSTGYLNIIDVIAVDPGATGLTYARLTSGSCDSLGDEATIYEGQLTLEPNGHYTTLNLYPVELGVGTVPLTVGVIDIGPYDPGAVPVAGHVLIAGFDGGPPSTYFNLCLRTPGKYTYCVHYQGALLCMAQFPGGPEPSTPPPTAVNVPPSSPTPAVVNAPPASPAWIQLASATSDDAGAWRLNMTSSQDLIGAGLTVMRVTSGQCDASISQATVFEAQLQATEAGDQSWAGKLAPVGAPAQSLPTLDPNGGDVFFIPTAAGTLIDAALDGVPPNTAFAVCLRS